MKILFRPHAMGITVYEALEGLKEFESMDSFYKFILEYCHPYLKQNGERLYIELYNHSQNELGADDRIGWSNTFLVGLKKSNGEYGPVLGFMCIQ